MSSVVMQLKTCIFASRREEYASAEVRTVRKVPRWLTFPCTVFINWFADYCRVRWAGDEVKASIGGFLPLLTAFNTHWERYLIAVLSLIPCRSHLPNSDPAGEKYPYDSVWDELQTALTDSDVMCCDPPVLCSRLWPGSLERASALQLPGRYLMSKSNDASAASQRCPVASSLAVESTYVRGLLSVYTVKECPYR